MADCCGTPNCGWTCSVCGDHIDCDHYNDVHTASDGEDVCFACCDSCNPTVAWAVIDFLHPDVTVTFDDQGEALAYALLNGCAPPWPIHDGDLYPNVSTEVLTHA